METMISLASKQIWPHILAERQFKPARLILMHTHDKNESEEPAGRMASFFGQHRPELKIRIEEIRHDDFPALKSALDEVRVRESLSPADTKLHFTGGNKRMVTAALEWALDAGLNAFYIERGFQMFLFTAANGHWRVRRRFVWIKNWPMNTIRWT